MKLPLGRICFLMAFIASATNFVWAGDIASVTSLGNGTYSVTATAHHKFTRNTEKLKAEALEAATQFCTSEGKQLKVVSMEESKSQYLVGPMAKVVLTFKALAPGDAELVVPQTLIPGKPAVPASPAIEQLFSDILRLDELRKKGLLTDAEFEAKKKMVLDRAK